MNGPNILPGAQAAAASFFKGQEKQKDATNARREQLRLARQRVAWQQQEEQQQKTNDTEKGTLA